MPTGEPRGMVAKLRGNGNLHLLDAESLDPTSFADSQAIIEFRQKLASKSTSCSIPLPKVSAGKATGDQ